MAICDDEQWGDQIDLESEQLRSLPEDANETQNDEAKSLRRERKQFSNTTASNNEFEKDEIIRQAASLRNEILQAQTTERNELFKRHSKEMKKLRGKRRRNDKLERVSIKENRQPEVPQHDHNQQTTQPEPATDTLFMRNLSDNYAIEFARAVAAGTAKIPQTLRELSPQEADLLVQRFRPLLSRYTTATAAEKEEIQLTILGFVPVRLTRRAGRQRIRKAKTAASITSTAQPDEDQSPSKADTSELRVMRRAISHAKRKLFGKAARCLDNVEHRIELDTASLLKALIDLHPERRDQIPSFPPTPPQNIALCKTDLAALCARRRRGASPGPSGWTEELLTPLFRDKICAEALAEFMTEIANNNVSNDVARFLAAARLVPIGKKDRGIRPVAVGDVFVRLIGIIFPSISLRWHLKMGSSTLFTLSEDLLWMKNCLC